MQEQKRRAPAKDVLPMRRHAQVPSPCLSLSAKGVAFLLRLLQTAQEKRSVSAFFESKFKGRYYRRSGRGVKPCGG